MPKHYSPAVAATFQHVARCSLAVLGDTPGALPVRADALRDAALHEDIRLCSDALLTAEDDFDARLLMGFPLIPTVYYNPHLPESWQYAAFFRELALYLMTTHPHVFPAETDVSDDDCRRELAAQVEKAALAYVIQAKSSSGPSYSPAPPKMSAGTR